jgi:hypothetical protein
MSSLLIRYVLIVPQADVSVVGAELSCCSHSTIKEIALAAMASD